MGIANIKTNPIRLRIVAFPPYITEKKMAERYNPNDIPFSALHLNTDFSFSIVPLFRSCLSCKDNDKNLEAVLIYWKLCFIRQLQLFFLL